MFSVLAHFSFQGWLCYTSKMLYDFGLGVMTSILIRPAQARDAKQRAYTRVYTRAIRGDYVVVPPHIYIRELMLAVINQRSLGLRILIGAFVPKAPDTLKPNGCAIIRFGGSSRCPKTHVASAPSRGASAINPFSL